jgi:hypothetical protein
MRTGGEHRRVGYHKPHPELQGRTRQRRLCRRCHQDLERLDLGEPRGRVRGLPRLEDR